MAEEDYGKTGGVSLKVKARFGGPEERVVSSKRHGGEDLDVGHTATNEFALKST